MAQTVPDIKKRLAGIDAPGFAVLERSLCADTRKGVKEALAATRRRLDAEEAEAARLRRMYEFEDGLADGRLLVGLDEVGRGPLAGPLAVGAVVLPREPEIAGLNDSKKLSAAQRTSVAEAVKATARAWAVEYVEADEIDAVGISLCLKMAFSRAVRAVEAAGLVPAVVLLDGNPLGFDDREVSVVKGDGCCASVAAASIVAKVERDSLMETYARRFPQYGFEKCKGYASPEHIEAIRAHGLCPLHRKSFCNSLLQQRLF
ncbi:MAG: ribonuclease HII [Eggerthellaceae bacterium]|nr:ribonuclease HII [Eggerthellaceae bacterium]